MLSRHSPALIVALSISLCVGAFKLYLRQSATELANQFHAENLADLSASNTFSLATKLNALSSAAQINCITGTRTGTTFFDKRAGTCKQGAFREEAIVTNPPTNDIRISIFTRLPPLLEYAGLCFVILQGILLLLLLKTSRRSAKIQADALAEKLRTEKYLSNLAAQVAHDIRSPLAALKVATSQLEKLSNDENDIKNLIHLAVDRITTIANDLLERHRLKEANNETSNIQALLCSLVQEKKLQFSNRPEVSITLTFLRHDLNHTVYGRSSDISRVVSNLINNSVEALLHGGTIAISTTPHKRKLKVHIVDNGPGINKKLLKNLGHRQISSGKEQGTGFGIIHAKSTIENMGGTFNIRSKLKRGTTISLTFKRAPI